MIRFKIYSHPLFIIPDILFCAYPLKKNSCGFPSFGVRDRFSKYFLSVHLHKCPISYQVSVPPLCRPGGLTALLTSHTHNRHVGITRPVFGSVKYLQLLRAVIRHCKSVVRHEIISDICEQLPCLAFLFCHKLCHI